MIELLLQAERLLAMGLVDQAERLYRQAADADPRSSIAAVGLARVALERADDGEAWRQGKLALDIDPENAAARRLVERLEEVFAYRGQALPEQVPGRAPEEERAGREAPSEVAAGAEARAGAAGAPEATAEAAAVQEAQAQGAAGAGRPGHQGPDRSIDVEGPDHPPAGPRAGPTPSPATAPRRPFVVRLFGRKRS